MRELPQVQLIGRPTSGGLSDILDFKLPNGWDFGLSNQTYLTIDGTSFEGIGIQSDVILPVEKDQLITGNDPLLQTIFEQADKL